MKKTASETNNASKLLIDEHPLQVLPTLAKLIGLNEAIVLQQVHYWLKISEASKDERKFKEDRWWTWGSVREWHETNFPFWSENTIQRIFASLEKAGLLISRKFNASKYDHTKWYSIDYDLLNSLKQSPIEKKTITPDRGNQDAQDGAILILTETPSEPSPENNIGADAPPPLPEPENDLSLTKTPGGRIFHALLEREYQAKKRRTPKNFPSVACQEKFATLCEGRLNGTLKSAIERALEKGIIRVSEIVDFVAKYDGTPKAPARAGYTPKPAAPAVQLHPDALLTEEERERKHAETRAKIRALYEEPQEAAHANT